MLLGVHQSFEAPMYQIAVYSKFLGSNTFQIYVRNNRNMRRRAISASEINDFNSMLLNSGNTNFVIHAPYAMNPCASDSETRERIVKTIKEDLYFISQLAGNHSYVLHPGSSMGEIVYPSAFDNMFSILHEIQPDMKGCSIALETMSGAGTQMLSTMDQLMYSNMRIDDEGLKDVGFCFDTCHVFAAGLNLDSVYNMLKDKIKVFHVNGSKGAYGSHLDRHTSITSGELSYNFLEGFIERAARDNPEIPFILEVPQSCITENFMLLKERFEYLLFSDTK